ncbi:uncharacterized protein MICPUCDRAFT_70061 [Micromonas pusilla CCMP1545]|uniref:Predicted protein n=1 Tax=Micromonas pusilla (strain CCMP1545) TaxID=564608 RepID=C1N1Z2_MICPC|nr:uncharacterized protein MICPUCDRAFT_70061 [Micromonas pusilla CCMP1545]EEH53915.1 predicted protein [Micromonas pusilla CCMP1545]|eukprot:XP_003062203.1 predicted protein [Micromonas pusilla CCMP1545]
MICAGEAIEGESVGQSCVSPVKRTNDVERKARGEEKREGKSSRNGARPAGTGVIVWESSLDDERTCAMPTTSSARGRNSDSSGKCATCPARTTAPSAAAGGAIVSTGFSSSLNHFVTRSGALVTSSVRTSTSTPRNASASVDAGLSTSSTPPGGGNSPGSVAENAAKSSSGDDSFVT